MMYELITWNNSTLENANFHIHLKFDPCTTDTNIKSPENSFSARVHERCLCVSSSLSDCLTSFLGIRVESSADSGHVMTFEWK